ncbi:unnamed protein product [Ambrosiozyma monospora]|uniref:Unnamed protein product n=1 Tax=Ambrosiozyma monospora TaxID=43982 RepID=A0ACB5TXB2_AMBMO|nr:unnamed protein product [Ambrosiozyma monospora]
MNLTPSHLTSNINENSSDTTTTDSDEEFYSTTKQQRAMKPMSTLTESALTQDLDLEMSTTTKNSGATTPHGSIFNRLISAFSSKDPSTANANTNNTVKSQSQSQSYYSDSIKTILSITQPFLRHTNSDITSKSQHSQPQPQQSQEPPKRQITLAEVRKHTAKDDLWMVVHGKVYDVTSLIDSHPGGAEVLTKTT